MAYGIWHMPYDYDPILLHSSYCDPFVLIQLIQTLLANPKMPDKLQFVGAFGSGRVAETSDKLKFVGQFLRPFALLPNSSTVSYSARIFAEKPQKNSF